MLRAGAQADTVCFTEYVQKNMALYEISNGMKLSTPAAAATSWPPFGSRWR